jgi:hypothetical protein
LAEASTGRLRTGVLKGGSKKDSPLLLLLLSATPALFHWSFFACGLSKMAQIRGTANYVSDSLYFRTGQEPESCESGWVDIVRRAGAELEDEWSYCRWEMQSYYKVLHLYGDRVSLRFPLLWLICVCKRNKC